MRTITWNFQIERGAVNNSFSGRWIQPTLDRVSRYFNVRFVQVLSNPWMRVLLTNQRRNANVAAWVSGRTVYIPASFRYVSQAQGMFVLLHEFGHVFGGSSHGGPNDVMGPAIVDVYRNLTANDYRWFRSLGERASPKAWNEPNQWRPQMTTALEFQVEDQRQNPIYCGHARWWHDWLNLTPKQVTVVE